VSFGATRAGASANPWLIAVLVALATFMEVLDTTIANVALRYIAGGLGVSVDEASWVVTTYLVANAVSLTVSAFLDKAIGRKAFFLICLVLFTASSVLCGIAWTLQLLLLFRIMQGLGGGGMVPVATSILVDAFPPEKRGQAIAVYGVAVVVAPVVGPTLGGWLSDNVSWHWCFLVNGPVGVITIALVVRDSEAAVEERRKWLRQKPVRPCRLRAGRDLPRLLGDRARSRARGRLVRLVFYNHGGDRLRARVCADDPLGDDPPQCRDRRPDGGDATVRRLLSGSAGDRRHPLRDHPIPAPADAGGSRLYGDLGRPRVVAGRHRHDGDDVCRRPAGGQDPAEASDRGWGVIIALSMYALTNVYGDLGFWFMGRCRMLFGVGFPLIFVSITGASYHGIPPDKTGQASALINAARNTCGSIGISLISNVLWRREQFHQTRLVDQALPSSVQYQDTLYQMTNYFVGKGSPLIEAQRQTIAWVGQQVQLQASFLAYMGAFWVLTLIALAAVPLALSLRKVNLGGGAPAGH
jgi:DHA2 family multidrug resistance protein